MAAGTKKAVTARAPIGVLCIVILWLTACSVSLVLLLPMAVFLLLPMAFSRRIFEWWAAGVKSIWLRQALFLLRVALGVRIVVHFKGGREALLQIGNGPKGLMLSANHRTAICWAWIWGLASAMGRLRGMKIVLMDAFRHAPGFGWAMQCFGFGFIKRNLGGKAAGGGGKGELERLESTIRCHGAPRPIVVLIFPEGRDLNPNSIAASNKYADAQDPPLSHYTQVLHPKPGGFSTACAAVGDQGMLLDVTVGYEDFVQGEQPDPLSMFFKGRLPSAVHLVVNALSIPADDRDAATLVRSTFAEKERRLKLFYEGGDGTPPYHVPNLLSDPGDPDGFEVPLSSGLVGFLAIVGVQFCSAGLYAFMPDKRIYWAWIFGGCIWYVVISSLGGLDSYLLWHATKFPSNHQQAREAHIQATREENPEKFAMQTELASYKSSD